VRGAGFFNPFGAYGSGSSDSDSDWFIGKLCVVKTRDLNFADRWLVLKWTWKDFHLL
jgi:hypothetical protein